jgi:hypothetical protein
MSQDWADTNRNSPHLSLFYTKEGRSSILERWAGLPGIRGGDGNSERERQRMVGGGVVLRTKRRRNGTTASQIHRQTNGKTNPHHPSDTFREDKKA